MVLFGISFIGNTWQREQQYQEMRRQADEMREQRLSVQEIKALLGTRKRPE